MSESLLWKEHDWFKAAGGSGSDRVTTDLENLKNLCNSGNLKETSENQGIWTEFQMSGKIREILLSEIYFRPS